MIAPLPSKPIGNWRFSTPPFSDGNLGASCRLPMTPRCEQLLKGTQQGLHILLQLGAAQHNEDMSFYHYIGMKAPQLSVDTWCLEVLHWEPNGSGQRPTPSYPMHALAVLRGVPAVQETTPKARPNRCRLVLQLQRWQKA